MKGRKNTHHLKYFLGLLPLIFFISLSLYLFFLSSPERVVDLIGVKNAYALIFILAFLGGLTTFSGVPYHLVLITLAMGDLNPWLLGISAAVGVMLGDTTSYYAGYAGGAVMPKAAQNIFQQWYTYVGKHPKLLPVFCLLYGSLVPLSNDFITISAGIARYPFWRVMIPLAAGNIIFNVSLAYLSSGAYKFLYDTLF
ncbi:MAG: VTT domain-containing protein [Candidatus Sungbacteria bacterium]|nr:VTT domain-containing protein [Candidatus Sungbacteria bacterium]